jgi:DNA polymerase-4
MKAAARLRRAGCVTRHVTLSARFVSKERFHATRRIEATDDRFMMVEALHSLWPELAATLGKERVRTIAVTLDDIQPAVAVQLSLFTPPARRRTPDLSRAMDRINERFGRNAVTLGPAHAGRVNLIGTKIAFGRIPDAAEFHE